MRCRRLSWRRTPGSGGPIRCSTCGAPHAVRETLSGAVATAAEVPGPDGAALLTAARAAFVASMHVGAWVGVATMLFAAVLALTALRGVRVPAAGPTSKPEPDGRSGETRPDRDPNSESVGSDAGGHRDTVATLDR